MAETAAAKKAREDKQAALEQEISDRLRAQFEAEYAEKLKAAEQARANAEQAAPVSPSESIVPSTEVKTVTVPEDTVVVHFLDDGLTANGKIWYRGETAIVKKGSRDWQLLTDPATGRMLFTLTEAEQVKRWGRRHFAPGPWPYGGFDLSDPNLTDKERARLAEIEALTATA